MSEQRKILPIEMDAFAGDVRALLHQIGPAGDACSLPQVSAAESVSDVPSLKQFLVSYAEGVLFPAELPAICKAHGHASRYECRELIALDQQLSSDPRLQLFGAASAAVGRTHLTELRPLRENRLVQRYLAALEAGQVQAWHTVVYGLSLSIYSVPLRQGLLAYVHLVLEGFAHAATVRLPITAEEKKSVISEVCALAPGQIDLLLNPGENLFKAA